MHAVLSGLLLPAANFPAAALRPSTTNKSIFSDKEIADGRIYFSSRRDAFQTSVSSIRAEGSRKGHPRKNSASNRPEKEDNVLEPPTFDESSRSSSQEEIIQLFKRIQSSISKGPEASKKRSSNSTKVKQSTESVLEALRKYPARKQAREKHSTKEDKALHARRDTISKEERTAESSPSEVARSSRPVSNFVKRSPIPSSPPAKEEETSSKVDKELPATVPEQSEFPRIDDLKLPDLKELARSKGVKGFSKLKKGELVEMLKGMDRPS